MADIPNFSEEVVEKIAAKWGKEIVPLMVREIASMNLVRKGKLIRSISSTVRKHQGQVEAVRFKYEWYGLIQSVGAKNAFGKGVTITPKPWQENAVNPNIDRLADAIGEYYAEVAIRNIDFKNA